MPGDLTPLQLNFVDGSSYAGQFDKGQMSGLGVLNLNDKDKVGTQHTLARLQ